MKYKMLVIDMDDTLLTDDHIISEENKEMLFKAQERSLCYFGRGDQHQRCWHTPKN
jgi:hydroxymethylpyrimidine pyrophosphatase-like HAD family hydrolase